MTYTTEIIISSIKSKKDDDVLKWMYKTIFPKVNRYILSNNGNKEDSKDIFQESVLTLYNLIIDNKYDSIKDIEGFIIVISRNKWINRAKRLNKQTPFEKVKHEIGDHSNPLVDIIMNERWEAFQKLFNLLGDKCKQLLTYSIYDKISMTEIAKKMNLSGANAAKAANYRCKQKMAKHISQNKLLANALSS